MDSNPSESEMMADLAAADSAGDTQLAKHIAGRIKTLRAAPTQRQPGQLEAGIEGGLQGASLGWGDEMRGAGIAAIKKVLPNSLGGSSRPMAEEYAAERDRARAENAAGEKAFPKTYAASEIGGGVATQAAANLLTGGTASLPLSLAQGGAAGAGYSNADSAGGLARDTAVGVGVGGVAHGAGTLLGKALSGVAGWARSGARQAESRAVGKAADEVASNIASARGSLGGEVQKGSRYVENLMRLEQSMTPEQRAVYQSMKGGATTEPRFDAAFREGATGRIVNTGPVHQIDRLPHGEPDGWTEGFVERRTGKFLTRQEVADAVGSGEDGPIFSEDLKDFPKAWQQPRQGIVRELQQRVAQSTLDALPDQAATIAAKDAELTALKQGASQALKDRTADLLSTDEVKRKTMDRVLRYGPVAAGSLAGHALGGPIGGAVGALAGAGTRPMVRSMIRLGKDPAVQKAVYDAVQKAAPATGQFLKRAIQAAALGPTQELAQAQ